MKILKKKKHTGAQLLVECLEAHGVKYVFGIPGAKIDSVFDALVDSKIQLIHCRHEQNAAFMAGAYGRITGQPGVVLVTSGPGVSNLATGLLTATTEGDPIVAFGGNVKRSMALKESHQAANNAKLLEAATKFSIEINTPENIPEAVANAFRISKKPRAGATFISLPQDIVSNETAIKANPVTPDLSLGAAKDSLITQTLALLKKSKLPVLLLGQEASRPDCTQAIRALLQEIPIPVVGTYQAAGVISRELRDTCFFGRVGLFKNQPGDLLLDAADLVITIGYNPAEYDPEIWNTGKAAQSRPLIHLDYLPSNLHTTYLPAVELVGDIPDTLTHLQTALRSAFAKKAQDHWVANPALVKIKAKITALKKAQHRSKSKTGKIHPLDFIEQLSASIDDNTRVISDIGSHYMWLARYLYSYEPHHLLFSNGQQTLGVSLPWAMASLLAEPKKTVISISGDGGFLFSGVELETAVREKLKVIHFVWDDQSYNMVGEQQVMKYKRDSGVHFGPVDFVQFAESLGAKGFHLKKAEDLPALLKKIHKIQGPVVIQVPINYADNPTLFKDLNANIGN